ncbi:MAG TPA: glycoside hydrolase family 55 protein [Lysobacter sp.]|nr:glycoside hydrolase family 55 protein [Lysobacter sp.]
MSDFEHDNARRRAVASALGASLLGFQSGTVEAQTSSDAKRRDTVSVKDFGAASDGVADDTAAIQAAINSFSGGRGVVFFPPGTYRVTNTIKVAKNRVHLVGAGSWATQILFAPTAHGSCFVFSAGPSVLFQGSVRSLGIYSNDSVHRKTAIEIIDTSGYLLDDIVIGGSVTVGRSHFWSGEGSIGIRLRGREAGSMSRLYVYADRPVLISHNPNNSISLDHFHFSDTYLGASGYPCVEVEAGSNLTQITFDGYNAWVGGTHGFYWNDTTSTQSSNGLHLQNVRFEQGTNRAAYCVFVSHNYRLQNVTFERCYGGTERNGYYLRKCDNVEFASVQHAGTNNVALDVDASVRRIRGINCFWQAGSTASLLGQRPVYLGPKNPSAGPLPSEFEFNELASAERTIRTGLAIFGSNATNGDPITMSDGDVQALGSANATGRLFLSTQEGFSAEFNLQGTTHTVSERDDSAGIFSGVKETANSWNVYWDAGKGAYVVQNKRGSAQRIGWLLIGKDGPI